MFIKASDKHKKAAINAAFCVSKEQTKACNIGLKINKPITTCLYQICGFPRKLRQNA
jgi:hypothetical protein